MARFELKDKHYLNVPGTEWEQVETDQLTGKPLRIRHKVGQYLNPEDAADCNYKDPPRIIVTTKFDPDFPRDIVFVGDCTIDMLPLDPEAKALHTKASGKFHDPMKNFDVTMSDKLMATLQNQMNDVQGKLGQMGAQQVPIVTPSDGRVEALEAELAGLKAMIRGLVAKEAEEPIVVPPPSVPAPIARRI